MDKGKTAVFIKCDVIKINELENLISTTYSRFGRIDCLINNAGTHPPHKTIDDFSTQDFRDLLELNLISIFNACKLALPHLRKSAGNIINMASLVGSMGQLHATTYVATKGAVVAFTKALAIDEAIHKVRVNSVSPGNIWTPMWKEVAEASGNPQKMVSEANKVQWLNRMGTIEEAGKLCLFLAADATFTTGVDHLLTGGAEIAYGIKPILETQSNE
eukprot:TRINITY_DN9188_c0_g1_i1.p1 TRINITY_DN9188_c0_g1~~TRINITY_DN9188_c0_g1_i1.p1  ORF type:complete len:217 (-),score=58.38 TRINITY_DN9188_c0_g1_i1:15-665(-)